MSIKTLSQLRQESKIHTDRATQLFDEATKIIQDMRNTEDLGEKLKLREEWLKKDDQAREALKKSLEAYNQFINQMERYKTYGSN